MSLTRARIRRGTALLALACVVGGCGGNGRPGTAPGAACNSSRECPGERVCHHGLCEVADASERRLTFAFSPPGSSSFQAQRAADVVDRPGERPTFALRPSLVVKGTLSFPDSARPFPPGTVVARRAGAVDDRPVHQFDVEEAVSSRADTI
ncbi:MAG: EB domain-containing protein [Bradymonadaceae bacterium]